MNKNESKYFNTAIKMDEALITLLEKKDFEYITIKEICDTAGVNRSTFYLHYENTSDLLKETTRYIIDKHLAYYEIDKQRISLQFETCKREELLFITDEYLTPYLTFIKDNQRLFRVSIKQFNSLNMGEVYGRMFEHIFNPILERFQVPEKERSYMMKFYLTGVFAIVMECVPAALAEHITKAINVPTIGIGAGAGCDGQILVYADMMGMFSDYVPKFVKKFANLYEKIVAKLKSEYDEFDSGDEVEENLVEQMKYISELQNNYVFNTNFLTDEQAKNIVDNLFTSNEVYIHDLKENIIYSALITDNNVVYKKYSDDLNLVQYSINIKESQIQLKR